MLVLAGVQNASAQIAHGVNFTTAFPFIVGNTTVPAGSYTVKPDDDDPGIFELSGKHTSVLFNTENVQAHKTPSKTEVVFQRYGDGYVLKDIWVEGSDTGTEAATAEGERHATKNHGAGTEHRVAGEKKADIVTKR
jgi:hypothetical protein